MSEQNQMSCGEFADVAAELALGVLTGRERAQAVAHLDECDSCREHVRQLSLTGEEMLGLLPSREPAEGFESRVMGRLGLATPSQASPGAPSLTPPRLDSASLDSASLGGASLGGKPDPKGQQSPKRWTRRMLTVAAAALAVVACGLGGWGLRGAVSPSGGARGTTAEAPLREAALLTAAHQTEGKVYLYDGSPRWLYMAVDTHGSSNDNVICQLETRGGGTVTIGSFRLQGGYGAWGSPDPIAASQVTGARLTTMNGTVLATASFTTSS
jgi:hypothetical protein